MNYFTMKIENNLIWEDCEEDGLEGFMDSWRIF